MKTKIVCILSMMAALGLASCGGEPASETPASQTPTSSTAPTSSRPTSSTPTSSRPTSSTPASQTPTTSAPVTPVAPVLPAYYVGMPFNTYEGCNRPAGEEFKWDKGATYKWTFNLNKAEDNVMLAVAARMSNASHSDRKLQVEAAGAEQSGDNNELADENQGKPRLEVAVNGVAYELNNTATYGQNGLSADAVAYLPLAEFPVVAGANIVELKTSAVFGFRLYFGGGDVRLYSDDQALAIGEAPVTSEQESEQPSEQPSEEPSEVPSEEPSEEPSEVPSEEPSEEPSEVPSEEPSEQPSEQESEPESSEELPPHEHVYGEAVERYNSLGKKVSLKSCADDDAKEISIAYADGETYKEGAKQAAVQTKMDNDGKTHTEWKINVDKAITGAKIYFEGSTSNGGRYFFNQAKVNPFTGEAVDNPGDGQADKETEADWRYTVSVNGGEKIAPKVETTMTEAGVGKGPFYLTDIDLAAGENVIKLNAEAIGYRITFSGNVYIRYEGEANIVGTVHKNEASLVIGEDVIPLALNEAADSKEYMALKVELDPEKPFAIHVWENDAETWLHASELKDGVTAAVDSENANHDIKVTEAGLYDIYVGVADLRPNNLYKCIWIAKFVAPDPVVFNWADAIQSGSPTIGSDTKIQQGKYTFKVNVVAAGNVTLSLTMKGSTNNGAKKLNGDGQGFKISANGKDGVFLGAGKTYAEFFGEDQDAWVVVNFGTIDVIEGENTIVIEATTGYYKTKVDTTQPITLTY